MKHFYMVENILAQKLRLIIEATTLLGDQRLESISWEHRASLSVPHCCFPLAIS
jgi:hypothetical protein